MKKLLLLLVPAMALGQIELSEKLILKELQSSVPSLERIESQYLLAKQKASGIAEKFGISADGGALYQISKEKSFHAMDLIMSPLFSASLGLRKKLRYGVDVSLTSNLDQASAEPLFSQGTTASLGIGLSIDLYKDVFGRLSRNELKGASFGLEKAKYQKNINRQVFSNSVRKIYWTIVANNESLKISNKLLETAKRQLKDVKKRFRDSVADSGEVARYESQVAARSANIIALKYQRETYLQQLKELLPSLSGQEMKLGSYNIEKTVGEVMACTLVISSQKTPPMKFTSYDEIIDLGKKEYKSNKAVADSYSRPDIKLTSEYRFTSKEWGYRNAFDGLVNDPRGKYNIGFTLNIPIDGKKGDTRDVLVELEKRKHLAEENEILGKVRSFHYQTVKSIGLLNEVSVQQSINSEKLEHSLKVTQKKYRQARISVGDLIMEQNAFLASKLDEIQTKLMIVTTLLDYLSVYTDTPCGINRK